MERKIYEELYPETKAGVAGGKASGEARGTNAEIAVVKTPSFVEDTAAKTGLSKRTIETEIQISKNIRTCAEYSAKRNIASGWKVKKVTVIDCSILSRPKFLLYLSP